MTSTLQTWISLREGKFAQVEFTLLKEDGTRVPCYGTYLISDNGFYTSSVLMDPPKIVTLKIKSYGSNGLNQLEKILNVSLGY